MYENKKILFMGDSITALGVWVKYFNEMIKPKQFVNIAVSSARWKDSPKTIYDGNPVFNGPDKDRNNTVGNQVEKLLRGKDSNNPNYKYNADYEDFDVIIVSAGTNDWGIEDVTDIEKEISEQFYDEEKNPVDLDKVNRKTMAGAMRYTYEKLKEMYPNASIFYCSPIQAAEERREYASIKHKRNYIKLFCERISDVTFVDTFSCGICGVYEKDEKNGRDLFDGLHPNDNGAKKIAKYNARSIIYYLTNDYNF